MSIALYTVRALPNGWSVESDGEEATVFKNGGPAEAHARRLAQASAKNGRPALVRVQDKIGGIIGEARYA